MITNEKIAQALHKLNIKEWKISGSPKNESEFNSCFKKIMSEDKNGQAVLSTNPNDFGITWTQIKAEMDKL